jgi:hypothetical protein
MTGQGFEILGLLPEYKSTAYGYTGLIAGIICNATMCNNMLKLYGKYISLQLYISLGLSIVCISIWAWKADFIIKCIYNKIQKKNM